MPVCPVVVSVAQYMGVGERHYFYLRARRWREIIELHLAPSGERSWLSSGDAGSQGEHMMFRPVILRNALYLASDHYLYTFDLTREFYATHRARRPLRPGEGAPLPAGRCFGNLTAIREGLISVGPQGVGFWRILDG